MNQRRPVPQIGRGTQNFPRSAMPPIPMPMGQPMQPQPSAISEVQDIAMEIYCRLAVDHIRFKEGGYDSETLRGIAKSAQAAAIAYFEAAGVRFQGANSNG